MPLDKVKDFETQLLQLLQMGDNKEVLETLKSGKLTPEVETKLTAAAKEVADRIASETKA